LSIAIILLALQVMGNESKHVTYAAINAVNY